MTDQERTELLRLCERVQRAYDPRDDRWKIADALQRLLADQSSVRGMSDDPGPEDDLFDLWWREEGRSYDPDTADVAWFEKRRWLAERAFNVGRLIQQHKAQSAHPQEQAAPSLDDLQTGIAELYQVIGQLADMAGCFDDAQVIKALDWAADPKGVPDLLPFRPCREQAAPAEVKWPNVRTSDGDNMFELAIIKLAADDAQFALNFERVLKAHISARPGMPTREQVAKCLAAEMPEAMESMLTNCVDAIMNLLAASVWRCGYLRLWPC